MMFRLENDELLSVQRDGDSSLFTDTPKTDTFSVFFANKSGKLCGLQTTKNFLATPSGITESLRLISTKYYKNVTINARRKNTGMQATEAIFPITPETVVILNAHLHDEDLNFPGSGRQIVDDVFEHYRDIGKGRPSRPIQAACKIHAVKEEMRRAAISLAYPNALKKPPEWTHHSTPEEKIAISRLRTDYHASVVRAVTPSICENPSSEFTMKSISDYISALRLEEQALLALRGASDPKLNAALNDCSGMADSRIRRICRTHTEDSYLNSLVRPAPNPHPAPKNTRKEPPSPIIPVSLLPSRAPRPTTIRPAPIKPIASPGSYQGGSLADGPPQRPVNAHLDGKIGLEYLDKLTKFLCDAVLSKNAKCPREWQGMHDSEGNFTPNAKFMTYSQPIMIAMMCANPVAGRLVQPILEKSLPSGLLATSLEKYNAFSYYQLLERAARGLRVPEVVVAPVSADAPAKISLSPVPSAMKPEPRLMPAPTISKPIIAKRKDARGGIEPF